MATNTYTEIARINGDGSATTITFSSIPSTYTDLVLVANIFTTANANQVLRVNGDSGGNYSTTVLYGNGTSALSTRGSNNNAMTFQTDLFATSTIPATTVFNFMNYANTNTFKTVISRSNKANQSTETHVNLWRNTAAITSITISGATFTSDATFSLYGIASEEAAAKATGGMVTSDANYYYHTFTASGTFTPKQSLSCDVLAIAGGGSGSAANGSGAGGGAGGVQYTSSISFASGTAYTATIGGGGAPCGINNSALPGNQGTNSNLTGGSLSLTAAVGGGFGAAITAGGTGGSGGGSTPTPSGPQTTRGAATTGQGFAGGLGGAWSGNYPAGGGGGAGAQGGDGATNSGAGGNGTSTYSSWGLATGTGQNVSSTYYYAGGGGGGARNTGSGGAGGYGGGAAGISTTGGNDATANTGGGGSGAGGTTGLVASGAGGSGLVIVRYAK
jgi:hypothetical protein